MDSTLSTPTITVSMRSGAWAGNRNVPGVLLCSRGRTEPRPFNVNGVSSTQRARLLSENTVPTDTVLSSYLAKHIPASSTTPFISASSTRRYRGLKTSRHALNVGE